MNLVQRDAQVAWHPYTQHGTDRDPLAVVGAEGARLRLADGRQLIDGISSWWAILHGHGTPELIDAMTAQARQLDHVLFAGATHEPAVALAEQLIEVAPGDLARVFYSDNGSTAVEVALKMAYHVHRHEGAPERTVFIALEGAYHGDTFGAMAVGERAPFFEPYGPFLFDVVHVAADPEQVVQAFEENAGRVCAMIVEPLIQGAAGMVTYPAEVLEAARASCDREGAFLIADEVMTGFGRTGRLFASDLAGVAPDLMCLSKGLTGGMTPLAATLATDRIFEAFVDDDRSRFFPHGHTWTGHPIGCAVALASLTLCRDRDVPGRFEAIGRAIESGVDSLRSDARVKEVRRLGGIVAVELGADNDGGYFSDMAPRIRTRAIELGVLLRPLGNVLYANPPACTTDAECAEIARAIVTIVTELPV